MTLFEWFNRLMHGGRPRDAVRPIASELDLPPIDPQPKGTRPPTEEDREVLEKWKRAQEVQLARLRILARIKAGRHDT